ncbi:MAG: NUDIX hydrolase [Phycisphaeraceae bacterium]|nr:NUDIX hydrolase [Phycisphaeraceae bacterium]
MQVDRVLDCEIFSIDRLRVNLEGGREITRHIVRHPGAVVVVPQLDDGRLVMIRNLRVSVGSWLREFCAGKLERGEDPALAAARELEEETGYSASEIRPLGTFYTSPGFADELMHAFVARGLSPGERRLEVGERIEVDLVPATEVEDMLRDGRICDGKTIAAFALWRLAAP